MKKETAVAVFFGILLGAVLAIMLISKNKEKQLEQTKTIAPTLKPVVITPVSTKVIQVNEISEPVDGTVTDKNTIAIKGKALKDSLIVIQSPIKELVFKNKTENLNTDFPLALGENSIKILIYSKTDQAKPYEKDLKIYYFDDQL